jgi:antitoxin PrlF
VPIRNGKDVKAAVMAEVGRRIFIVSSIGFRAAGSLLHAAAWLPETFTLRLQAQNEAPAMTKLTVAAKGQVTLGKDLLEHLRVRPGEKITVDKLPDGRLEVKAARPTGKISDAFGCLKAKIKGRSLSIEEINEVIARGWAGKR